MDVFAIQDEIAKRIVTALEARLMTEDNAARGPRRHTPNIEAYHWLLRARHHRFTTYEVPEALSAYEQATAHDPGYAEAHVGVAYAYTILSNFGLLAPREARSKGRAALSRALAIDDHVAAAHATLGFWLMLHEWNWTEAERAFQRALTLDPRNLETHAFRGLMCAALNRPEEALEHGRRLRELDPLSPWTHGVSALVSMVLRRAEEAVRFGRQSIELRPDSLIGLWALGHALRVLVRHEESIAVLEKAVSFSQRAPHLLGELGLTYADYGRRAQAEDVLRTLEAQGRDGYAAPFWRALVTEGLGRTDDTFDLLERAYDEAHPQLMFLNALWWNRLRSDRRFAELVRRVGLPPSVAESQLQF